MVSLRGLACPCPQPPCGPACRRRCVLWEEKTSAELGPSARGGQGLPFPSCFWRLLRAGLPLQGTAGQKRARCYLSGLTESEGPGVTHSPQAWGARGLRRPWPTASLSVELWAGGV